jgi:acetyl esterase/lipase
VPTALLVVGIVGLAHVLNAFSPRRDRVLMVWSFFAGWLTNELAPWWLFWQVVAGTVLVANGALDETVGWIGLALLAAASAGLVAIIAKTRRTTVQVAEGLRPLELDPEDAAPTFPRSHSVFPFLMPFRRGVRRRRNIQFGEGTLKSGKVVRLRLDVTMPVDARPGDRRPGILQVHGGAWVIGDKREQGISLLGHLAATKGWVGINANYRLSPRVRPPEHLIDLKKAVAWWREHADEYGGDPDFLVVSGGSAGGHLSTVLALTANDPRYQPGFEDVDTTLNGAVPFYGLYDLTNRNGRFHKDAMRRFYEPMVFGARYADEPQLFHDYSPIDLVRPDAPPFLVIHGSHDTLAPVADARDFVHALRDISEAPVLYMEMQGAQHAFDVFPSFRTARVIEGVERFLTATYEAWLKGRSADTVEAELVEELAD